MLSGDHDAYSPGFSKALLKIICPRIIFEDDMADFKNMLGNTGINCEHKNYSLLLFKSNYSTSTGMG